RSESSSPIGIMGGDHTAAPRPASPRGLEARQALEEQPGRRRARGLPRHEPQGPRGRSGPLPGLTVMRRDDREEEALGLRVAPDAPGAAPVSLGSFSPRPGAASRRGGPPRGGASSGPPPGCGETTTKSKPLRAPKKMPLPPRARGFSPTPPVFAKTKDLTVTP